VHEEQNRRIPAHASIQGVLSVIASLLLMSTTLQRPRNRVGLINILIKQLQFW